MKVLVTGASGFVGSHVAERLAQQGHELRLLLRGTSSLEFLGDVVFERADGDVLKYDQFGAHAARIVPGQTVQLAWQVEDTVLHTGTAS